MNSDVTSLIARCGELLDQLAYTADEVEALRSVINRVPEEVLLLTPDGNPSIKSILGAITERDEEMSRVLSGGDASGESEAKDWDALPTDELLAGLQANRRSFVASLRAIADRATPEVLEKLEERIQQIVRQDVDAFREVATRLHSAGIGAR